MDPNQQAILKTSENALHAKAAAVRAGYYDDDYITPFVHEPRGSRPPYVQPIIKRGTHARVCCIDRMIQTFAKQVAEQHDRRLDQRIDNDNDQDNEDEEEEEPECVLQIVILGCGKDTVFFRHYQGLTAQNANMTLKWFEVDHPPMISEKANIIGTNPNIFDNANVNAVELDVYEVEPALGVCCTLLGHDLRETGMMEKLQRVGCDPATPTLFILECVLMYLPESDSQTLLKSIPEAYKDAYLCLYEPILGNDAFGNVMEQNLVRAGLATPPSSLLQTRQLNEQLAKVVECGWKQATACDLWHAYDTIVTAAQRQRGNRAEFLDEWEEFVLIMQHYCFLVAATAGGDMGNDLCQIAPRSLMGFSPGQAEHLQR
mmetsp:Transcript_7484/g.14205  ORF Transcript_7484/g.14205 Transcript_7484/m.14205 type:complete len:373 (-) Transcript_7484:692-1810(-)|eukprot:scaffold45444_cov168-Amphora_coffeaeformis.AAC.1